MTREEFAFYDREMREIPKAYGPQNSTPACCEDCEYQHPEWKYRFCLYTVCPYKKLGSTIRDVPLAEHPFKPKEVLNVSGG